MLAALVAACGPLEPGGASPTTVTGGKADAELLAVAGSHELTLRAEVTFRNKATGEELPAATRIGALVLGDGSARVQLRPCWVKLPEREGHRLELSPQTVDRMPAPYLELTGSLDDLRSSPVEVRYGMNQRDDDLDGKPGITVRVSDRWEIYAGFEIRLQLFGSGELDADDQLTADGWFDFSLDEQIYGDTIKFLFFNVFDAAKSLEQFKRDHEIVDEQNRFALRPLPAGATCDTIRQFR